MKSNLMWMPLGRGILGVTLMLLLLGLLGAGCQLSKPYPAKRLYQFVVKRSGAKDEAVGEVLRVRPVQVAPAYGGKGLVTRLGASEFVSDYYSEWLTSPGERLTTLLSDWMRQSGRFRAVTGSGSALVATRVLECFVDELYVDLRDQGTPRTVLSLHARVIDDSGALPESMGTIICREVEPVEGASAAALVAGWNRSLARALAQLEGGLVALELGREGRRETERTP